MKVEIISIGDELLIGQTVNTNASWMGTELSLIGAEVEYGTVIRDEEQVIYDTIDTALNRADVVLVTGGLGPTKDDITKKVLCDYFDSELIQNDAVLEHVKSFFEQRKRAMLDVNVLQAAVPDKAEVLHNESGTAPGMWFEKDGKVLVSMPGVPYEMKYIMQSGVIPRLQEMFEINGLYYRTIHTQGIGESYIADQIIDLENEIRESGVSLAYLPSPGLVRMRLSSVDSIEMRAKVDAYVNQLYDKFPKFAFGIDENDNLSEAVRELLKKRGGKLGTVESCTGGAIAAAITSVSSSSAYFEGSIVTYSKEIKKNVVGVQPETIESFDVVSKQVAEEMALGGNKKLNTNYCIAITGNAGPTKEEGGAEIGEAWIAIAVNEEVEAYHVQYEKDRERNIRRFTLSALNLLRCKLM